MTTSVGIYIFENAEVLDFAGPYEVFTTANRVFNRSAPGATVPFEVFTIARSCKIVTARAGLKVVPDYAISNAPKINLLVIAGGVVDCEVQDEKVVSWVRDTAGNAALTASVCTGAFLLAKAGLLDGKNATTHWEDMSDLRRLHPEINVKDSVRWVDEGSIIKSAGIAAGIDMSLFLVARLHGADLAQATAKQMDVPYRDEA